MQLIGGEVSLLAPDDHAAVVLTMRAHGREPISFSHGDFDPGYLDALVLDDQGRRRIDRLSFGVHIDSTMLGRRGITRTDDERELDPSRQRCMAMLTELRRRHGVRSFVAHNMTVTPENVGQVAEVIRANSHRGFGMFSFQPAAHVGDERRWRDGLGDISSDARFGAAVHPLRPDRP